MAPATAPKSLRATLRFSQFAQRALAARPALADEIDTADLAGWDRLAMDRFLAAQRFADGDGLARTLRALRERVLLRLAVRDLAGIASLEEVHITMSELADLALQTAHRYWSETLEREIGVPTASNGARQSLVVVGMGKLGGRELNVSSDIDLIFLYPEEGETRGARAMSNEAFFARLGQRIISTLNDRTADGFVFRVDMRLRPWGDGGPLATSFGAFENYLVIHGREWERYAWIKARVITGDPAHATELHSLVRPFVYRRYLDYGAIGSLRDLHAQIRSEVARRDFAEHVKLGPGGIREIEFIVQAIQLIHAGRDAQLQMPPTIPVLRLLVVRGLVDPNVARELATAYAFLRRLEHRLQYAEDEQTHLVPSDPTARALIAESMGYPEIASFDRALNAHRDNVSRHFAAVFNRADAPAEAGSNASRRETWAAVWAGSLEDERAVAALAEAGMADPAEAYRQLRALATSSRYRGLPAASQARLDQLAPRLIEAAVATPVPDAALGRLLRLLEAVAGRSSYLALLVERGDALARTAQIAGASSWGANFLTRHPVVLEELLDPRLYTRAPSAAAFAAELRETIAPHDDAIDRQMDLMRELHHAQIFRLLVQDLDGRLPLETLADHLSALADAVIAVTIEACWRQLSRRHRDVPAFGVIAYGKLGGKELGYASDLDLAFVYDDDDDDPAAPENYARLGQRIVSWLSSHSGAGRLFETDLRLRPNGEAGLLAISIEAFRKYQDESAWVWEHQALTRARFCAGDASIGRAFEDERVTVLRKQRDPATIAKEVVDMREKLFQGHPNRSGLFDVKHGRGGMIDIEFAVQYLVLVHAAAHAELVANLGNIALLGIAAQLDLIPSAIAEPARTAYREFRRIQHRLRLNEAEFARVPHEEVATHTAAARALWETVFGPRPPWPR